MTLQDRAAFSEFSSQGAARTSEGPSPEWRVADTTLERLVLDRLLAIKVFGGLPLHLPPLAPDERAERTRTLLHLWESGCRCAVDERLFADLLNRYRADGRLQSPE